jgi:hypothetical protein
VLVLIAVGATVGAIASAGDDDKPKASRVATTPTLPAAVPPATTTTPPTQTATTPTPPLNPRHIVRRSIVGSSIPVADDGILFRVERLQEVHAIPHNRFTGPIVGSSRKRLIRADIVYVNRTKRATDVFCGGAASRLEDSAGHRIEPLDNYIDIRGNEELCGGNKVGPGETSHVTLAFKIPRPRQVAGIFVHNAKADDFDGADTKIFFAAR